MHDIIDIALNALLGLSFVFFPMIYIINSNKSEKKEDNKENRAAEEKTDSNKPN